MKKLKCNKGFTMTEILITVLLMTLFTSMVITANRMLAHIATQAITISQQTTLSSVIINAISAEMRTATDIETFSGSYIQNELDTSSSRTTHSDHGGFVYNSKLFDYKQQDPYETYREIIFVDSTNYKLYVGKAHSSYSLSGSTPTSYEEPKALIGGAMYGDSKVYLYDAGTYSRPSSAPDSAKTGISSSNSFRLVIYIEDTASGTSSIHNQTVNLVV